MYLSPINSLWKMSKKQLNNTWETKGEYIDVNTIEVVNTREEIPIGIYDVKYIYTFAGLKIKAEQV